MTTKSISAKEIATGPFLHFYFSTDSDCYVIVGIDVPVIQKSSVKNCIRGSLAPRATEAFQIQNGFFIIIKIVPVFLDTVACKIYVRLLLTVTAIGCFFCPFFAFFARLHYSVD